MKKMLVLFSVCVMLFASCAFARTAKDGFKPEDCEAFSSGGITFSVPNYFTSSEEATNGAMFTTDQGDAAIQFLSDSTVDFTTVTAESFDSYINKKYDDVQDLMTVEIGVSGLSGFYSMFQCTSKGTAMEMVQAMLYKSAGRGCVITFIQTADGNTDYLTDVYKIIATAQPAGAQAKTSSDDEKPTEKSADASSSDFRKSMDDYKAFFEEYCEFMKKYMKADATDMASMLTDYTEFLTEYQTAMDALDNVDTSKLSTEDQKYYFDTMAEIQKMLLEVSQ